MNKNSILIIGGCGYIGSQVYRYLNNFYKVESIDLEWFGNHTNLPNTVMDYNAIDKNWIKSFETVILLAGMSSVKMSSDLSSTHKNNVTNFINLIQKLDKSQRFIYASSSSIYGGISEGLKSESEKEYRAINFYDLSKYEIDQIISLYDNCNWYGLRFGTVNSSVFNLPVRSELMINSMYYSSVNNNVVNISNPDIHRPILGMSDLCYAIRTIIDKGTFENRGIYNLASFNLTVREIAQKVLAETLTDLKISEDCNKTYDFSISTKKFETTFNFKFLDTVKSIIDGLKLVTAIPSNRNEPRIY